MRATSVEERVRDYVAAERAAISIPPRLRSRILRAVESSRPARIDRQPDFFRIAALVAALALIALGAAWIRIVREAAPTPAGMVQGSWSPSAAMPVGRAFHTATLLPNGKILVLGGDNGVDVVMAAELYDPRTRGWSAAGSPNVPLYGHTATLLKDGRVLVVGGADAAPAAGRSRGSSQANAELYDPRLNRWSQAASLATPRAEHTATLLADGRVLVVGGATRISIPISPGAIAQASAELYDPETNRWSSAASLAVGRARHSAILLADHRVLVVGGCDTNYLQDGSQTGMRSVELYDPTSNTWSDGPSMQVGRVLPTLTLLPDGRVLAVGDMGTNEFSAEIFDPGRNDWSPAPPPGGLRAGHIAVSLRGGNVLVAGGVGEVNAQIFDWRRNLWLDAGNLTDEREGATATVLSSGQVLVAGGFTTTIPRAPALRTVDLYDPTGSHPLTGVLPRADSTAIPAGLALVVVLLLAVVLLWAWRRNTRVGRSDQWIDPSR